ncbi:hypothetical protein [Glutamicibacter sp.]|uniref:hypothetical protein n=1 Tax=Glutamicibacter sp. TaxID=1931995 RepID=UPI0028BD83BA|nr:hypothetical protein [Glutamicibacter sp.]
MSLFIALVIMSPWLETKDVQSWRCTIEWAEPITTSGGRSSGSSAVAVHTENCGTILLNGPGATYDTYEKTAANFSPGTDWIFEIGWFSQHISPLIPNLAPSTKTYYPAS